MTPKVKAQRDRLIQILIFPIKEIWIPVEYEEALLNTNIWPADYDTDECQAMIDTGQFQRGNTIYNTKAQRLEYANYYGEIVVPKC